MITMPNNKKHILFSLIMTLPFFPDVFYLALAVVGTSIIDFDHNLKINNLFVMTLLGILLTLILYIFNLPVIWGLLILFLALLFFICKDRGFMHSLFGVILTGLILTALIVGLYFLLLDFTTNKMVVIVLILAFLGFLSLNLKLVAPYIILVVVGLLLLPNLNFNVYSIFGAIILGFFSHLILDMFTPNGVQLFGPLYKRKFHKTTGLIFLVLWVALAIFYLIFK
jgi:inner membrane protein